VCCRDDREVVLAKPEPVDEESVSHVGVKVGCPARSPVFHQASY
jgi:hypothetical protein